MRRTPTGLRAHVKGKSQPLSDEIRRSVLDANDAMAERALRVIAVAERAVGEDQKDAPADSLETGLTAFTVMLAGL